MLRAALAAAVQAGVLHPSATSDEAPRLFTIVLSGVISQQMANEPAAQARRPPRRHRHQRRDGRACRGPGPAHSNVGVLT